jgi:hypothetical protein
MKHLSLILSLLSVLVSGSLKAAPLTAAPDTLQQYFINGQRVEKFDGSQLVGKTIEAYTIDDIISPYTNSPVRVHSIVTEGSNLPKPSSTIEIRKASGQPDPVFVIDGKRVTRKDFEALDPMRVESITVVKNGTVEEVKKYEGWENGVILIETKKDGDH